MSDELIGLHQRLINSNEKQSEQEQKALQHLKEKIPYLFESSPIDKNQLDADKFELLLLVSENYNKKTQIFIYNKISELIIAGNTKQNWGLVIPKKITPIQKAPPLKNMYWQTSTIQISDIFNFWKKDINSTIATFSQKKIICHLTLSAIFFGGLQFTEGLVSLINHVHFKKKALKEFDKVFFVELKLDTKKHQANYATEKKLRCVRTWFPDHESLLWINHFLKLKKLDVNFQLSQKFTVNKLWKLLKSYLTELSKIHEVDLVQKLTFKNLCKGSNAIIERE
jgi:hypothetical protein